MPGSQGTLRDKSGNPLHPATVADRVLCAVQDGSVQPLSLLLTDLGVTPTVISEETFTLEGPLEAGDLYEVSPYIVGSRRIQLWIDGAYAAQGEAGAWQEHGTQGEASTFIYIRESIEAGRVVTVRVGDTTGKSMAIMPSQASTLLVPADSRAEAIAVGTDFTVPSYIVGSNRLQIWLDGILCMQGNDPDVHSYVEMGETGEVSTAIHFHQDIPTDFEIFARVL